MSDIAKWLLTQGVLGVATFVAGAIAFFLYKENKVLTARLIAKSETNERENKETAQRVVTAFETMARKQGTRVRRQTGTVPHE